MSTWPAHPTISHLPSCPQQLSTTSLSLRYAREAPSTSGFCGCHCASQTVSCGWPCLISAWIHHRTPTWKITLLPTICLLALCLCPFSATLTEYLRLTTKKREFYQSSAGWEYSMVSGETFLLYHNQVGGIMWWGSKIVQAQVSLLMKPLILPWGPTHVTSSSSPSHPLRPHHQILSPYAFGN